MVILILVNLVLLLCVGQHERGVEQIEEEGYVAI